MKLLKIILLILIFQSIQTLNIFDITDVKDCKIIKTDERPRDERKLNYHLIKHHYIEGFNFMYPFKSDLADCREKCLHDKRCFSIDHCKGLCYFNTFHTGEITANKGCDFYLLMECETFNVKKIKVAEGCMMLNKSRSRPNDLEVLDWYHVKNNELVGPTLVTPVLSSLEECKDKCLKNELCYSIEYSIFRFCYLNGFSDQQIVVKEHHDLYILMNCDKQTKYGKLHYLMIGKYTFKDAQSECQGRLMKLYLPENKEKEKYFSQLILKRKWGNVWIDASDLKVKGQYVNKYGEHVSYIPWSAGEPNNLGNKEHCVFTYFKIKPGYLDVYCNLLLNTLCEEDDKYWFNV